MVKYLILILLLHLRLPQLLTQNLVPNSSFEKYKKCPEKENEVRKNVAEWSIVNKSSPDYFNNCSSNKLTSPEANFGGSQQPFDGDAYVGIVLASTVLGDFREYIQCKLAEPLKRDQLYCCSFYISLSDKSSIYTNRVGMYLSSNKIKTSTKLVVNLQPQIENKVDIYLNNKNGWTLICDTFKAIGGEQYITVGNFYDNKHSNLRIVDNIKELKRKYPPSYDNATLNDAYYYLDNISVISLTNKSIYPCQQEQVKDSIYVHKFNITDTLFPQKGESIILKNVVFETNKSTLLPSSYTELDNLVKYLKENNSYRIEITGHTDNVGKEEDNLKLSDARAKAVSDYLISKDISESKIVYKGFGSKSPIVSNDTEEGRQQNRRVEFRLFK